MKCEKLLINSLLYWYFLCFQVKSIDDTVKKNNTCDESKYGCCLDGVLQALGPNYLGCPGMFKQIKCTWLLTFNANPFLFLCWHKREVFL